MTLASVTPSQVRSALLLRNEIALLDLRHEAAFATGHPLFAANMAADRITLEAEVRLPRKDVPIVLYDADEGLVSTAARTLAQLGYGNVHALAGGLKAWQDAGYELFQDVNSYAKAFGELVEARRHTPSLSADDVAALISSGANIAILDVRRFDEYATMNIPGSVSVPGAELVLRAGRAAPDPQTGSWLAQMGWEVFVLDGGYGGVLEATPPVLVPKPDPAHRYRRPYEGTDASVEKMQAYLDWEYGLVEQLRRDGTHGFVVI